LFVVFKKKLLKNYFKPLYFVAIVFIAASCVTKKKFVESQSRYADLQAKSENDIAKVKSELVDTEKQGLELRAELKGRQVELINTNSQLKLLQDQLDFLKKTNTNLLDRLSDLSVVNKTGAENMKKSLDALNDQSKYIKELTNFLQKNDSVSLALVMNLKKSLDPISEEDVQVEVKKNLVYITISDQLLFGSTSSIINSKAETTLEKIAKVLNDYPALDILIKGHTDNLPRTNDDNWDLSTKRASSLVRVLQSKFGVAPQRMTAGGRSEFEPKVGNDTDVGRQKNKRTEIIVTPNFEPLFELLGKQK
jgi:chemotaxis protein MotB